MVNGVYVRIEASVYGDVRLRLVSIDEVSPYGDLFVTLERVDTRERKSNVMFNLENWYMVAAPVPYMM